MASKIELSEDKFYPIWKFNFYGQLRKLHADTNVVDEGQEHHFYNMPFDDFCLIVFEERQDLIDDTQN